MVEEESIRYEWREALCRMNVTSCGHASGRIRKRRRNDCGFVAAVGLAIKIQAPILLRAQLGRKLISEAGVLTELGRNFCNEPLENIIFILTYVPNWRKFSTNTLSI